MSESASPKPIGRLCGVDYGTVRVGIALTDFDQRVATPFEIYNRRTQPLDAQYFKELVVNERVLKFIIGLPVFASGGESQKSREVRKFGDWLKVETGCEIEYFDERYTSVEADQLLRDAGLKASQRKGKLDKIAACLLLTAYLEGHGHDGGDPGALEG